MTGVIVVRDGKGRKDRVVPVHPDLAAELRTWVLPDGARYIDITAGRLGRIVAAHLRAHGIEATLHCGRHSFGTEAARVIGDVMKVAQLMGHENPATTMGYIKLVAPGFESVASMYQLEV